MAKKKILITVKTYPTLSKKYDELVCTAGIDEEGNWYRLYPIPFRKLDYESRYPKYSWIELDIEKNTKDLRKESFKPINVEDIKIIGNIPPDGGAWIERRRIVLNKVYTNLKQLIAEAKNKEIGTSLAVFKAKEISGLICEETEREWDPVKLEYIKIHAMQLKLFENSENPFEVVKKLPYRFSYVFIDDVGKKSKLMIEDWEIGELYWKCLRKHNNNEELACEDVHKMYFDNLVKTKDLYLFLGTLKKYHNIGRNPFTIVGVFYPKKIEQPEFDFV